MRFPSGLIRAVFHRAFPPLLATLALSLSLQAKEVQPTCPALNARPVALTIPSSPTPAKITPALEGTASAPLIVIGFMGGHVSAGNLVHREAQLARDLESRYPLAVDATVFANHDWPQALATVLRQLDRNNDGCLSPGEKNAARIVIYGHSWGASETVTLARRLNRLGIPVLLTVQVDSVQKADENDQLIPPNVHQAVNFYQADGLLHGRSRIAAMEPSKTAILGNFASSYREKSISCDGYPWFARTFMHQHIEIENDPAVWKQIETMIAAMVR